MSDRLSDAIETLIDQRVSGTKEWKTKDLKLVIQSSFGNPALDAGDIYNTEKIAKNPTPCLTPSCACVSARLFRRKRKQKSVYRSSLITTSIHKNISEDTIRESSPGVIIICPLRDKT